MTKNNRGFLIYVLDDDESSIKYESLAKTCTQQLRTFFPKTSIACVIWDHANEPSLDVDFFIPIKKTLQSNVRNKHQKNWYNLYRLFANTHSPFDQTVMLDVDYWCFSSRLEWFFHQNFGVFSKSSMLGAKSLHVKDRCFGDTGVDIYWATVLGWKNTEKNNDFWQKMQENVSKWQALAWMMNQSQNPIRFDHILTYTVIQENFFIQTAPFELYHNYSVLNLKKMTPNSTVWYNEHHKQYFEFFNDVHLVRKQQP